jgi:hypothetical protein
MQLLKRSKYLFLRVALLTVLMFVLAAAPAGAATFPFVNITGNNSGDAAIGEAQLSMEVTQVVDLKAAFLFTNQGPDYCSLTDVYFADGAFFETSTQPVLIETSNAGGVIFSSPASPKELPGAPKDFKTTQFFTADALNPATGVEPFDPETGNLYDEWLKITFSIKEGKVFDDVIDALGTGEVRVGVRLTAFDSDGSESFVHAPIPASVLLLGSGLIGLVGFRRKKIAK